MFVTAMTHFIISHVNDFCLHQSFNSIQTFVYKPLYVLTLRQDKGRGIRRINPSTAIILLCLPIEKFGVSFQKTPEIEYRNVTKII